MKYVISGKQKEVLEKHIMDYLQKNISPYNGWNTKKVNVNTVEDEGEQFWELDEFADPDNQIWYTVCDNHNLESPLEEGTCPAVVLPTPMFNSLNSYFGDFWKPLFINWFNHNTGLRAIVFDKSY